MLKIDPIRGTEKIQAHKAKLYRESFGNDEPRDFGLEHGEEVFEQDGFTVTVALEEDNDFTMRLGDDEALGEFGDYTGEKPGEYIKVDPTGSEKFTLERAGVGPSAHSYGDYECYWSNGPTGTVAEQRNYYSHTGMSKQVAEEMARANQRMFYERALRTLEGDLSYVAVVVTVERAGREFGRASLAGIESDAGDYFNEVAEELIEEAVKEANRTLDEFIESVSKLARA